jgi:hypothetical protein
MSFIDDEDDDTDDDRLASIRRLWRPLSSLNYPTPAGANSGGSGGSNNALYSRYQGMRSVSSLQKSAGVLQHPQRRSVSLLNGYPDHLKYRLERDRPISRAGRKSSLGGGGGGESTTADMWSELDLIKERMQRLNVGTSSGRATPQPVTINRAATAAAVAGATTAPVVSSANTRFGSSNSRSTIVPSDRLFQRQSNLTGFHPGSDNHRSVRMAAPPLASPVVPAKAPLPVAPVANAIDFVPLNQTPTSLSQHHLQSVLVRLGGRADIDSLLLDRACSDLLRVYPTTTTPQQREALDQVCLSMANFVIKMLDDSQQQNGFQREQQQQPQQQSHFPLQPLQRDLFTTPETKPFPINSIEISEGGPYGGYHDPNASLKLDTSDSHHFTRGQQQHSRRPRKNSLLFHKDDFVARDKSFSGIFPEIRARQN